MDIKLVNPPQTKGLGYNQTSPHLQATHQERGRWHPYNRRPRSTHETYESPFSGQGNGASSEPEMEATVVEFSPDSNGVDSESGNGSMAA